MSVVRHDDRTGQDVEIVDQADQDGVGWRAGAGLQQRERVDPSLGLDGLDRRREVGQELPQIGVAWVRAAPLVAVFATAPYLHN